MLISCEEQVYWCVVTAGAWQVILNYQKRIDFASDDVVKEWQCFSDIPLVAKLLTYSYVQPGFHTVLAIATATSTWSMTKTFVRPTWCWWTISIAGCCRISAL